MYLGLVVDLGDKWRHMDMLEKDGLCGRPRRRIQARRGSRRRRGKVVEKEFKRILVHKHAQWQCAHFQASLLSIGRGRRRPHNYTFIVLVIRIKGRKSYR